MDDVKVLLERRKEIRSQINKLETECQAIEHILLRLHNFEHPTGISIETEIQRLQKMKEEDDKITGRPEKGER
jgi:hypothetical protein